MKSLKRICTILIALAIFFPTYATHAQEQAQEKPWSGTLRDGTTIYAEDLKRILADHKKWLDTEGKKGKKADLSEANLQKAKLLGANLQKAILWRANLQGAYMERANLQGVELGGGADLQRAKLVKANLQGAYMVRANLQEAYLGQANLQGAYLREAGLKWAYLGQANLQGADLEGADLQRAKLIEANLQKAKLVRANLQGAYMVRANLQEAKLVEADLQGADLEGADLQRAKLVEADLQGADLEGADLQGADLVGADLQGADLVGADLKRAVFQLKPNSLPEIRSIAHARSLSFLTYKTLSYSLVELRSAFKKYGLRKQEREVTYAIKHSRFIKAKSDSNLLTKIEGYLGWFFFELTCKWGMAPVRPLLILVGLVFMFTIPYTHAISGDIYGKKKTDGIWKVWIPGRMRKDMGEIAPEELLDIISPKCLLYGFYFSILSAFHVGWRDLNVGNWIARIQPYEYRLQATGWARTVSGIQSLISVYLLALSVLTYFGRPFESY